MLFCIRNVHLIIYKILLSLFGSYNFFQYLVQPPYQIERQVDEAEFLAIRCLHLIHGIGVRPDADGYVYIRIVHERLEGTEMGVGATLHFYRVELGFMGE